MAAYNKFLSFFSRPMVEETGTDPVLVHEYETDSVSRIALELAYDIIGYFTESKPPAAINSFAITLRRTVDELSDRHQILFNGILRRLSIGRETWEVTFTNVADEMFADGQYNWGRLVTLYAFAGWMARHCMQNHMEDVIPMIARRAGIYVSEKLVDWIKLQGGWETFGQFFPEKVEPENVLWNGLLYTFVGLGALATMAVVS